MTKLSDLANAGLEDGDDVKKTYYVRYDGNYGHLVLSKRKLQFVKESGLFRKKYDMLFEIPYERIDKITPQGKNKLQIRDLEHKDYSFETIENSESIVESTLRELISSANVNEVDSAADMVQVAEK